MANNTTRSFSYKASRDIIGTAIGLFFAGAGFLAMDIVLGILLMHFFLEYPEDVREFITIVNWIYIGFAVLFILWTILDIISNSFQRLEIKTDEIVYSKGWLTKSTITVPAHQIRSYKKTSGLLQRKCGTMSITITTAGDLEEIHCYNIGDGEKAYQMICELAKKGETGRERKR